MGETVPCHSIHRICYRFFYPLFCEVLIPDTHLGQLPPDTTVIRFLRPPSPHASYLNFCLQSFPRKITIWCHVQLQIMKLSELEKKDFQLSDFTFFLLQREAEQRQPFLSLRVTINYILSPEKRNIFILVKTWSSRIFPRQFFINLFLSQKSLGKRWFNKTGIQSSTFDSFSLVHSI